MFYIRSFNVDTEGVSPDHTIYTWYNENFDIYSFLSALSLSSQNPDWTFPILLKVANNKVTTATDWLMQLVLVSRPRKRRRQSGLHRQQLTLTTSRDRERLRTQPSTVRPSSEIETEAGRDKLNVGTSTQAPVNIGSARGTFREFVGCRAKLGWTGAVVT